SELPRRLGRAKLNGLSPQRGSPFLCGTFFWRGKRKSLANGEKVSHYMFSKCLGAQTMQN
ncbi:hypothetical protein ORI99_06600, partial [Alishewanella sp. SMS9]|nr:hypothetical protein [Alishewanella sp. SMS9]